MIGNAKNKISKKKIYKKVDEQNMIGTEHILKEIDKAVQQGYEKRR